jgi:ribosomal protein L11 methylase PrmA
MNNVITSSFRDPSGFVFFEDGCVYRRVNDVYKQNYDHLIESGLYRALVDEGLLIDHEELDVDFVQAHGAYKILRPRQLSFISYPYEWCFSQLKAAALTTLKIQKIAFDLGMTLKDASAYNIQFVQGRPVLIDTLSFKKYCEGEPWVAYKQFCQHFLAPLELMSYTDIHLNQLLRIYIDGIPLDLASRLSAFRTWFKFPVLVHIHLHAKSQQKFAHRGKGVGSRKISRLAFVGLIDSLKTAIKKLRWEPKGTEWAQYYEETNYSPAAMEHKKQLVAEFIGKIKPAVVWDLGANTGLFSSIAAATGAQTLSFDVDPAAVEKNYLECTKGGENNILPLLLDLTNPSPGIGWQNRERTSFIARGPADMILALALIHHLAISSNLPFDRIADFFGKICDSLIIEFVPKSDSQVQRLLSTREDIFTDYRQDMFEEAFRRHFTLQNVHNIRDSERTLYFMTRQ